MKIYKSGVNNNQDISYNYNTHKRKFFWCQLGGLWTFVALHGGFPDLTWSLPRITENCSFQPKQIKQANLDEEIREEWITTV